MSSKKYKNILEFSDLHAPAMHPDTIPFLAAVQKEHGPFDLVICNGDLLDFHACSRWARNEYLPTTKVELDEAVSMLEPLYKLFPKVKMTYGNHDIRIAKKCQAEGIPKRFLKNFLEAIDAPKGWEIEKEWNINTPGGVVKFVHDVGAKLIWKAVSVKGMNIVQGHRHTLFEIQYVANELNLHWGATTGCLVDHKHPAFDYGRTSSGTERMLKPIIGCSIIRNGHPILVPMSLKSNGRWTGKLA